ncbi:MAG: hypothetical protein ACREL1_06535 [bacterium]
MKTSKKKWRKGPRLLLLLAMGALPWSCATVSGVPTPDSMILSRADQRWPETTTQDLVQGRADYIHNCAACHALHDASDLTPDQWAGVMLKMQKKARLDDATAGLILRYLSGATTNRDPGVD